MAVRFKQLSKTSTEWASLNPTLLEGEIGFEKDTKKIKVGDGITAWNNLDYVTGSSSDLDTSNLVDLTSEQTITGLKYFAPNKELTVTLKHTDGKTDTFKVNHTYNMQQIEWFKAGSALNNLQK